MFNKVSDMFRLYDLIATLYLIKRGLIVTIQKD